MATDERNRLEGKQQANALNAILLAIFQKTVLTVIPKRAKESQMRF